ncbi:DUF1107 family protein [Motilimonas eburnea]|uniref:DUF1107 family protein n=1 Tax=Motilimonas eburnea TaxID=1737488 RepID=UPI001E574118|nr:DUF1107 family protein [Motilimonas eburnea]MCE2573221.1 DUF1107 domain-containing protein [Motilimonas eburnea]
MKEFKVYNPVKVAKYVKSYFTGQLFIQGIGRFEFCQGKMAFSEHAPLHYKRVASEVNKQIKAMRLAAVA